MRTRACATYSHHTHRTCIRFKVQNLRLIMKGSWRSFLCWHCICGSDGEGSVAEVCGSVVYLLDASSKESITSFFTEHEKRLLLSRLQVLYSAHDRELNSRFHHVFSSCNLIGSTRLTKRWNRTRVYRRGASRRVASSSVRVCPFTNS